MTFDDDPQAKGWKSIYLGLYSPFSNKYTSFMKHAIEKAKENSQSPTKKHDQSRNGAYGNNETLPTFVQLMQLSHKNGNRRNNSLYEKESLNGDKKSEKPPSRTLIENQEMNQSQWQDQQEMQYILMFEGLSKHKQDIIESQIRNGNQNFMAQKYLQLVSQKKLKRTLQDVFKVKTSVTQNKLLGNDFFHSIYSRSRKSSQRIDLPFAPNMDGITDSDLASQSQYNNQDKGHQRSLSLNDFKYTDLRWNITVNKGASAHPQDSQPITRIFRSQSASGRFDLKVINKNFLSSRLYNKRFVNRQLNINIQPLQRQAIGTTNIMNQGQFRREIIRRKSCECLCCGGETKKIPIAALYEEDENQYNESDYEEEKEVYSTGITLKFPTTQNYKPKAASIFKNLIGAITKSPSNRQQLKNSKTQANLIFDGFASANTLKVNPKNSNQLDFFDKEKIMKKYKGTKQFGGLSPIYDIERHVKKKMGLNKSRLLANQHTQMLKSNSVNKINLFSPNGNSNQKYKKLVTVDSMHSNLDQSEDRSSTESPDSTKKVKNNQNTHDNFNYGLLNLKTLQLPKESRTFFNMRHKNDQPIIDQFSETQDKQVQNDSKILLPIEESHLPQDLMKSRNYLQNITNNSTSQMRISKQASSMTQSNTNHRFNQASMVLYKTQNKFLDKFSSFQVDMKYTLQKQKELDFKKSQFKNSDLELNQRDSMQESNSQILLPQISSQKQLKMKKSNSQQKFQQKRSNSKNNHQNSEQKIKHIKQDSSSKNNKDLRDHMAYEKVYFQRISKLVK
eukprot:403332272